MVYFASGYDMAFQTYNSRHTIEVFAVGLVHTLFPLPTLVNMVNLVVGII